MPLIGLSGPGQYQIGNWSDRNPLYNSHDSLPVGWLKPVSDAASPSTSSYVKNNDLNAHWADPDGRKTHTLCVVTMSISCGRHHILTRRLPGYNPICRL